MLGFCDIWSFLFLMGWSWCFFDNSIPVPVPFYQVHIFFCAESCFNFCIGLKDGIFSKSVKLSSMSYLNIFSICNLHYALKLPSLLKCRNTTLNERYMLACWEMLMPCFNKVSLEFVDVQFRGNSLENAFSVMRSFSWNIGICLLYLSHE